MERISTPVIGIGGIVFDQSQRVLLVKRGNPPAMDKWHVPGGKLQPGESMADACAREVEEETGVGPVDIGPIVAVVERRLEGFHYVIIDFLATLRDGQPGEPRPADDAAAAAWIAFDRLDEYELATGLRPILEQAFRMRFLGEHAGLCARGDTRSDFVAG